MSRYAWLLLAAVLLPAVPALADDDEEGEEHGIRGREGVYLAPVGDPAVQAECGACHLVFPPQFLPARSWQALMADLGDHFGEDASLPEPVRSEITNYLVAHAADAPGTREGRRFLRGLDTASIPLRISLTPWWQRAHDEIRPAAFTSAKVKSPANCAACHLDAAKGDFSEPE
jgi:hypothetical protein